MPKRTVFLIDQATGRVSQALVVSDTTKVHLPTSDFGVTLVDGGLLSSMTAQIGSIRDTVRAFVDDPSDSAAKLALETLLAKLDDETEGSVLNSAMGLDWQVNPTEWDAIQKEIREDQGLGPVRPLNPNDWPRGRS